MTPALADVRRCGVAPFSDDRRLSASAFAAVSAPLCALSWAHPMVPNFASSFQKLSRSANIRQDMQPTDTQVRDPPRGARLRRSAEELCRVFIGWASPDEESHDAPPGRLGGARDGARISSAPRRRQLRSVSAHRPLWLGSRHLLVDW